MDATALLAAHRIIPVVVIEDAATAVPLARTLVEAGLGAIEVTLRTDAALDALEAIARDVPEILAGAGSVRRASQFADVVDAGARFAVCPGASPSLLDAARRFSLPFVPGAATPTEIIALLDAGYALQKFFPAETSGGVNHLTALSAPLPEVRFFPTGGITPANAPYYLDCSAVACIGGSWIAPRGAVTGGNWEAIGAAAGNAAKLAASP